MQVNSGTIVITRVQRCLHFKTANCISGWFSTPESVCVFPDSLLQVQVSRALGKSCP